MLNVVHATVYESSVRADYQALFNAAEGVTEVRFVLLLKQIAEEVTMFFC